jgi:hypothetical protein
MRMAIWPSLPYKKLITLLGGNIYQQTLFSFLNRPFFPLGFGHRLRFLLRLLGLLVFNRFPCTSKSF